LSEWQKLTRGVKVVRSAELVAIAGELGYFDVFGAEKNDAVHAAVYALRGYGCSLTNDELKEFEELII
jgi:hypothetical protein